MVIISMTTITILINRNILNPMKVHTIKKKNSTKNRKKAILLAINCSNTMIHIQKMKRKVKIIRVRNVMNKNPLFHPLNLKMLLRITRIRMMIRKNMMKMMKKLEISNKNRNAQAQIARNISNNLRNHKRRGKDSNNRNFNNNKEVNTKHMTSNKKEKL